MSMLLNSTAIWSAGLPSITAAEATVTMTVTRSRMEVAPETIIFEIDTYSGFDTAAPTGTFDERWHDFVFLWNFGDTGATYTLPTRLPSTHLNANIAYGPAVAHTFSPGTYNVTCLVIEPSSGKTAEWAQTITVQDPDVVFSGKTLTVHPSDGGYDYSTLTAALNAANTLDARRIVLARGQTFDMSAGYNFRNKNPKNVYVCAESGAGDKPIVTSANDTSPFRRVFYNMDGMYYGVNYTGGVPDGGVTESQIDFVWSDIRFEGPWDTATEASTTASGPYDMFVSQNGVQDTEKDTPRYVLFHNCEADGLDKLYYGGRGGKFACYSNCNITNWRDYGFLGGATRVAFIGTKIEQKLTALGGGQKDGNHNNHGPIRVNAPLTVMDGCQFYSNTGWFLNQAGYNTQQPCVRIGYVAPAEGQKANFQRCVMEGGFDVLNITLQNSNNSPQTVNMLFEKLYLLGTHMSTRIVTVLYGGVTLRNNVMVRPNTPVIDSGAFGFASFVSIDQTGLVTGNEIDRILVEHNQYINLISTANGGGSRAGLTIGDQTLGGAFPNNLIERHNVLHEPNLTAANVPYTPLSTATIFTPYCDGYRARREVFTTTLASEWANGATIVINYSTGNINDSPTAASWQSGGAHMASYANEASSHGWVEFSASYSFGASSVTITNNSGAAFPVDTDLRFELERNSTDFPALLTAYATPAGSAALYRQASGSAAIDPGSPGAAYDDYFGTVRTGTKDLGAFEGTG